ncbi:type II toxin-antitoxin system RelE family toxin [Kitasatospora azatica]|uniref:type II toxin-antitoxin system RelE family toxin n=1 Tax=Kitasatospora azatica TaxID=58347 RepID=UPI00055D3E43|nr:type II toxin-antitoxin system RelE/ParE family toxin [Kitasatospora azatica]
MSAERWEIRFTAAARCALAEELPEEVAAAAYETITGAIAVNPHRVGKPLDEPYDGLYSARRGTYRILYEINEAKHTVEIIAVRHRRSAYRT